MTLVKEHIKKYLWIGAIGAGIFFFVNTAVNANQEFQADLVNQYYGSSKLADSVEEVSDVYIATKADSIANFANTLLGKRYSYGKSGPESFDCSGFVFFTFKKFNISLPRSSRSQAKQGKLLKREEIKKGDLLFFKSPSPNNPNIGHVGIVLEVDNGSISFIHSSTGRGVVIDSLESNHYSKRFIEARRVIN